MLGICLCFKDSAAYLDEWLRFHYVQGFRRFFLYNNESSDAWRETVRPWIDRGLVIPKDFPGKGVQVPMYDDCIRVARGKVDWLAFLDDDEFLYPSSGGALEAILDGYSGFAGVAVNWMLYGSCGHADSEQTWVIERFTRRGEHPDNHVKCIVRPDRVERSLVTGHSFESIGGYQIVDENRTPMTGPFSTSPSAGILRINHYLIKSWEEWRFRRGRPQVDSGKPNVHPEALWRTWDESWTKVEDRSAQRFVADMQTCAIA